MLQGVWKQHLRPRAVVGYGFKIFLPSPPNYVTRSPGMHKWRPKKYSFVFVQINRSDEGLTLETPAFQIFHGGNSAFINSFDKTKFLF